MAFTENPSEFLDSDDFAVDATYDAAGVNTTIQVIHDKAYLEDLATIAGTGPVALCLAADVAADPTGKTLLIGSTTYTIKNSRPVPPDGVHVLLDLQE